MSSRWSPSDDDEELIPSGEVARRLGVTTHAVGRWVAKGLLSPAVVTPGGRYRFRWSEVAAQLKAQQDAREQGQASDGES
jgi:excisionase family DNA binding protein